MFPKMTETGLCIVRWTDYRQRGKKSKRILGPLGQRSNISLHSQPHVPHPMRKGKSWRTPPPHHFHPTCWVGGRLFEDTGHARRESHELSRQAGLACSGICYRILFNIFPCMVRLTSFVDTQETRTTSAKSRKDRSLVCRPFRSQAFVLQHSFSQVSNRLEAFSSSRP